MFEGNKAEINKYVDGLDLLYFLHIGECILHIHTNIYTHISNSNLTPDNTNVIRKR